MKTQNKTEHTPGPWYQHCTDGKTYASVRGADNSTVADCGSRSDERAQANARLIASAPLLYLFVASKADSGDKEAMQLIKEIDHANP